METKNTLQIRRLKESHTIKPFDCGDDDLNEFFIKDAILYQKHRLAITYFEENENQTIFFFSLANDRITTADTTKYNKIGRNIPNAKRRRGGYPAVKIGRLGVSKNVQSSGIGTVVMDIIKNFVGLNNYPTGAKFLTVDAYNNERSIKYYERNGFDFLTDEDSEQETRAMYYDLAKLEV
ncbi:MAG: GNAT family N-acetyltransferase [Arcicella sp.]|jgi:GNAT superfamily N-acetyltransferase|nr:GNAT family N-acetyltransferase [Arcicella sp.]